MPYATRAQVTHSFPAGHSPPHAGLFWPSMLLEPKTPGAHEKGKSLSSAPGGNVQKLALLQGRHAAGTWHSDAVYFDSWAALTKDFTTSVWEPVARCCGQHIGRDP
eukprot:7379294-Prymnesium_polylepis.2